MTGVPSPAEQRGCGEGKVEEKFMKRNTGKNKRPKTVDMKQKEQINSFCLLFMFCLVLSCFISRLIHKNGIPFKSIHFNLKNILYKEPGAHISCSFQSLK